MYAADDTIVAIATPHGRGGIGVVRLSGPSAHRAALQLIDRDEPLEPRHATFARTASASGVADQVVVTYFKAPQSYTGEDVVEISAHGSPVLLRGIVRAAMSGGSRLAEPGEFTFRAFLNRRIDLVQAEAVRDLIEAVTPLQARTAFDQLEGTLTDRILAIEERLFDLTAKLEASIDFPDEGYHFIEREVAAQEIAAIIEQVSALLDTAARGRLIREGLHVAIAGRPNVGKSSLFNRLAGADRAIVSARPGTTRDLLAETIDVLGIPMVIVDTAGVRADPTDEVESAGIARAAAAQDSATTVVLVLDRSAPLTADDWRLLSSTRGRPRVIVANKSDLPHAWALAAIDVSILEASAETGLGVDCLREVLAAAVEREPSPRDTPPVVNLRHADLLAKSRAALERAAGAAAEGRSEEFVLADIHDARGCLEEVTGARTSDEVLATIFSRFCIGK